MQTLFNLPKIIPEINLSSLKLEISVDTVQSKQQEWIHVNQKNLIESILRNHENEFISKYTNLTETTEILGKMLSEYREISKRRRISLQPKLSKEYPTREFYFLNQIKDVGKKIEKALMLSLSDIDKIMEHDDPELSSLAFLWKSAFCDSLNAISHINNRFSALDLKRIWRGRGKKELSSILDDYYSLYTVMIPTFTKIMNHINLINSGQYPNDEQRKIFMKQLGLLTAILYGDELIPAEELEPEEIPDIDSLIAYFEEGD